MPLRTELSPGYYQFSDRRASASEASQHSNGHILNIESTFGILLIKIEDGVRLKIVRIPRELSGAFESIRHSLYIDKSCIGNPGNL